MPFGARLEPVAAINSVRSCLSLCVLVLIVLGGDAIDQDIPIPTVEYRGNLYLVFRHDRLRGTLAVPNPVRCPDALAFRVFGL